MEERRQWTRSTKIDHITLGHFAQRGFYNHSQYDTYNKYSNTNDLSVMADDQLAKMRRVRTSTNSQLFVLSWTLTLTAVDVVSYKNSIRKLANVANSALRQRLLRARTPMSYPNIIYIDNFCSTEATSLAMEINNIV